MHILFLTDNFPPEVNAPATRTFEHCREWVREGHQVTVVTCVPNFPAGVVFEGYRNRPFQVEENAGIRVVRVWSYIAANERFGRRILDYASYVPGAVLASLFARGVDIVVATSPQLFTPCAGLVAGALKRVPFVFELRDLWPASIRAVGAMQHSLVLDRLERLELHLYRKAASIVSVTHAFCDDLAARGIDRAKMKVVTNGVDTSRFLPREKDTALLGELDLHGKFVAGYIGTHGMAHDLGTVLDAAARLRAKGNEAVRFLFLGNGARKAELMRRAKTEGLTNVVFVDTVPRHEVPRYWSLLDASIIHLKRTEAFRSVIPSKLFESMGMGVPVLHGVEGESAEIVKRESVGLAFEPGDPEALCAALTSLQGDPGLTASFRANGPIGARRYDRSALAADMLSHLQGLVDDRRARAVPA